MLWHNWKLLQDRFASVGMILINILPYANKLQKSFQYPFFMNNLPLNTANPDWDTIRNITLYYTC